MENWYAKICEKIWQDKMDKCRETPIRYIQKFHRLDYTSEISTTELINMCIESTYEKV